jgi:deazaflavin-dependent oxidoreductase (nitroreductase family)
MFDWARGQFSDGWDMGSFYPSTDWAKFLAKAPLGLWRLGLGPIIGKWLLVLTTTGRKSGLPRHTMVEYHVVNGKKYAPSGFGARSQYYQNILADPRVTIQTAGGTERAKAVRVTDDQELLAVFAAFEREDPGFLLQAYFKSLGISGNAANIPAHKDKIFVLRFDPTGEVTPAGLEIDLAWLWPVALLSLLLRRVLAGRRAR